MSYYSATRRKSFSFLCVSEDFTRAVSPRGSRFTLFVYLQCNLCRIWEEWRPGDENRHLVCENRCGGLCGSVAGREEVKTEEIWEPEVRTTRVTQRLLSFKLQDLPFLHIPSHKQLGVQEELSVNVEFVGGDLKNRFSVSSGMSH